MGDSPVPSLPFTAGQFSILLYTRIIRLTRPVTPSRLWAQEKGVEHTGVAYRCDFAITQGLV